MISIMPGSYLLDTNSKFILSYSNHVFFLTPISQAVPISVFSILLNLTSIMFTEQSFSNHVLGFKNLVETATSNSFQRLQHPAQRLSHHLRQITTECARRL